MADPIVRVEGLAALRRDLRRMQPDVLKEMRAVLKSTSVLVAQRARQNAPRRTGKLAGSYRAGTAGNTAFVRSRLPQAAVHEYGGTIRPRGAPIAIRRSAPMGRALRDSHEEVTDMLGDGLDNVATRHGWH